MAGLHEQIVNISDDLYTEAKRALLGPALHKLKEHVERGGLRGGSEYMLEAMNLQPEYPNYQAEARRKLQTERGIVIANHPPGFFDIPAILKTIDRPDLKVMVNEQIYPEFVKQLGEQYFMPASHAAGGLRDVLKKVSAHIAQGGVLMFFPTGAQENTQDRVFKSGFRSILNQLRPEDMVYSFCLDPHDVVSVLEQRPGLRLNLASEVFFAEALNMNRQLEPIKFRVYEKYSQAAEWQTLAKQRANEEINSLLSRHYEEQFSSSLFSDELA
ncbi:MAG: hypothetical protein HY974_03855 [Candidatus Kerfeldbacteria bacterium]|nr:hypothetical protein [Candidatus Kerfeldbacteria bacterium]